MARSKTDDDESLRRLGGGRWQTRDERFTIEPQSGTWVIVDGEQADDLGMPLIRGPYRSLTDAKAAIGAARTAAPPTSPLAERVAATPRPRAQAKSKATAGKKPGAGPSSAATRPEREEEPPPPELPDGVSIETIWIVEVPYAKDAKARRPRFRFDHLDRTRDLLREGRLIEAGGYLDFSTALLLVRASSEKEAIALVRNDVYTSGGVWTGEFRAREFGRVVITKK